MVNTPQNSPAPHEQIQKKFAAIGLAALAIGSIIAALIENNQNAEQEEDPTRPAATSPENSDPQKDEKKLIAE